MRDIIERAGAMWVGLQDAGEDCSPLVMFRDQVTGSTLAISMIELTAASVMERLLSSRAEFGVKVAS